MGKDKGKFATEPLNVKLPREGKTSLVNCFTTKKTSGWGGVAWGYFLGVTLSLRYAEVGACMPVEAATLHVWPDGADLSIVGYGDGVLSLFPMTTYLGR